MQVTISFRSGFDVEGVVLSITEARLRVAMRDWDDVAEFYCRDGHWFSENRDLVHIAWPERLPGTTDTLSMERLCVRISRQTAPTWVN
jgi:hypothetical protein